MLQVNFESIALYKIRISYAKVREKFIKEKMFSQ